MLPRPCRVQCPTTHKRPDYARLFRPHPSCSFQVPLQRQRPHRAHRLMKRPRLFEDSSLRLPLGCAPTSVFFACLRLRAQPYDTFFRPTLLSRSANANCSHFLPLQAIHGYRHALKSASLPRPPAPSLTATFAPRSAPPILLRSPISGGEVKLRSENEPLDQQHSEGEDVSLTPPAPSHAQLTRNTPVSGYARVKQHGHHEQDRLHTSHYIR